MAKTVTLRIDDRAYALFRSAAAAQRRSLANLIETAALRNIEEEQFTDPAETNEILSNRSLTRRLARAHSQAKRRKGSFVRGV